MRCHIEDWVSTARRLSSLAAMHVDVAARPNNATKNANKLILRHYKDYDLDIWRLYTDPVYAHFFDGSLLKIPTFWNHHLLPQEGRKNCR